MTLYFHKQADGAINLVEEANSRGQNKIVTGKCNGKELEIAVQEQVFCLAKN
ncbi:hypothetical protein PP707_02405 [Acetobacter pasteurianus]|nr:hypothetical protein [Acetobacter pasteurianus]